MPNELTFQKGIRLVSWDVMGRKSAPLQLLGWSLSSDKDEVQQVIVFILSRPNTAHYARWTISTGAVRSRGHIRGCGTQCYYLYSCHTCG